jgi:hypothetical protein
MSQQLLQIMGADTPKNLMTLNLYTRGFTTLQDALNSVMCGVYVQAEKTQCRQADKDIMVQYTRFNLVNCNKHTEVIQDLVYKIILANLRYAKYDGKRIYFETISIHCPQLSETCDQGIQLLIATMFIDSILSDDNKPNPLVLQGIERSFDRITKSQPMLNYLTKCCFESISKFKYFPVLEKSTWLYLICTNLYTWSLWRTYIFKTGYQASIVILYWFLVYRKKYRWGSIPWWFGFLEKFRPAGTAPVFTPCLGNEICPPSPDLIPYLKATDQFILTRITDKQIQITSKHEGYLPVYTLTKHPDRKIYLSFTLAGKTVEYLLDRNYLTSDEDENEFT